MIAALARGEVAVLRDGKNRAWVLKQLADDGRLLAFRYVAYEPQRGLPDWVLVFIFYTAIPLVLMIWLWPLTRDLRSLERARSRFADRDQSLEIYIKGHASVATPATGFERT